MPMVIYQSYQADLLRTWNHSQKFFEKMTQTEIPVGRISQSEFKPLSKEEGFEGVEETFEISIIRIDSTQ